MADWLESTVGNANTTSDGVYARSALWADSTEDPLPDFIRDRVDTTDPACSRIIFELGRMRLAGVKITPEAVDIAVKLGKHIYRLVAEYHDEREALREDVVYYIRRGDLIKIGWTTNLEKRMADLIPDEILAVEPGDRSLETARHRQFAEHRAARREYFRPHVHLLAHIERVRREYGVPQVNYRPLSA